MHRAVEHGTGHARGAMCGIAAAALFGMSAPFAKVLLPGSEPIVLAGLLYLGAALALTVARGVRSARESASEAGLRVLDVPVLLAIVLTGGVLGPALMLSGLERVSGVAGSLLLTLEAPLTMIVAMVGFGEHMGRRGLGAAVLIFGGGLALAWSAGDVAAEPAGAVLLAAACLCWAIDNNLTQRLSLRDPVTIVQWKAAGAAAGNLILAAVVARASLPGTTIVLAALALGALSYGASILLDVYALRLVGAAREAANFATAPFFGAALAAPLLGEAIGPRQILAALLMAIGVVLLLRERHEHFHVHAPLVHEHAHVHDDHHQHPHDPPVAAGDAHTHQHEHGSLEHSHPHVSDAHHRHGH